MSLCRTRNLEESDPPEGQINDIIKLKNNSDENHIESKKEKKKKISIPKDSIYKEDEEIVKNNKKNENKTEKVVEIINTDLPKEKKENINAENNNKIDNPNVLIKEENKNINNIINEKNDDKKKKN